MAELITGRGGTDHVDSEDFGAFNAVTLGDGTYILSGCSMAMKTATTLHIAAGELLMQGRHVRIKGAGEDVDVAVGTTGYNRNDIVALHYKQEGGIESVSVEVVAGTPTTGAASDPELGGGSILNGDAEAYAAIARVPIAGLAPSEPVVLVGGLKSNSQLAESISALGDSVSPKRFSPTIINLSGGELNFFKIGKLAVCNFNGVKLAISVPVRYGVNISRDMPKPPAGYEAHGTVSISMSDQAKIATLSIAVGSDGVMSVVNTGNTTVAAGDAFYGSLIYALA